MVLGLESRALCTAGKHSIIQLPVADLFVL